MRINEENNSEHKLKTFLAGLKITSFPFVQRTTHKIIWNNITSCVVSRREAPLTDEQLKRLHPPAHFNKGRSKCRAAFGSPECLLNILRLTSAFLMSFPAVI